MCSIHSYTARLKLVKALCTPFKIPVPGFHSEVKEGKTKEEGTGHNRE